VDGLLVKVVDLIGPGYLGPVTLGVAVDDRLALGARPARTARRFD
jgi:hypothetical protein